MLGKEIPMLKFCLLGRVGCGATIRSFVIWQRKTFRLFPHHTTILSVRFIEAALKHPEHALERSLGNTRENGSCDMLT